MNGTPGIDYPEDRTPVDVLAASRGDAMLCFVERVADDHLVVSAGSDRLGRIVRLQPGERLELVWKDGGELRAVPAEVVDVDTTPQETWRVRIVGPATRGQRRAAVRAPLPFRTTLTYGDVVGEGTTVDISEGGIRAWFDLSVLAEHGTPTQAPDTASSTGDDDLPRVPEIGSTLSVTVWLDDRQSVTCKAEVTRHHQRNDRRTELSLRFIGLSEKMEDLIRREVFAGLRDLRARGLI